MGCSLSASATPAIASSLSITTHACDGPVNRKTLVTFRAPSVMVPVLSKTTVVTYEEKVNTFVIGNKVENRSRFKIITGIGS